MHGAAVAIRKDLDLDVAAAFDQLLDEHAIAAERRPCFGLRLGVRGVDLVGGARDPHAAATAAVFGLEQQREAELRGDATRVVGAGEHAEAAGNHGQAGGAHRGLRARLATHHRGDVCRWPDERHAVLLA